MAFLQLTQLEGTSIFPKKLADTPTGLSHSLHLIEAKEANP
ncbi:hypothetical protein GCHA_4332 [Paraglaciecola chathamensis S18K6]|uniref:Uncharacterized protein n=1 Tax=Paraglaciecola chathamensis S18K6 TaxID=1127672 RepID=A0AAV3V6U9_9ALTE|nr:hypothetical protein GCHA_4332 [Paraglaciecola chathamensis S18K6]